MTEAGQACLLAERPKYGRISGGINGRKSGADPLKYRGGKAGRSREYPRKEEIGMSGKIRVALAALLVCLLAAMPALAAGVFQFTERSVTLHEGDTFQTVLRREGVYDGDGTITYSSTKPGIASVSEDGTVTAAAKGEAVIYANLMRNGKRVGRAQLTVKVARPVTKVTLSTNGLAVYEPDDETDGDWDIELDPDEFAGFYSAEEDHL